MSYKKISLEEALDLESESLLTLYDITSDVSDTGYHPAAGRWIEAYQEMLYRFRQYRSSKVLSLLNCNYIIEVKSESTSPVPSTEWRYIYGKLTQDLERLNQYYSKGQYIYVLTNECYPDIVKIGKAVNPLRRIEQINGAGVLCEWKLRYSLAVENDYMIESAVHNELSEFRRTSLQGSSREFFEVSVQLAVETIKRISEGFTKVGREDWYD